ncbi:MAG: hypothetical protein IPH49_16080 [Ignavibacteria bacterium]|nr:hypothetical protein [Ignavibacteria bacterium]
MDVAVIAKKNPYRNEKNRLKGDDPTEDSEDSLMEALAGEEESSDELTPEEMLGEEASPEESPEDVDPKLWAKAQEQAESEGLGTNEKYIKFLYTELQEEETGVDLDGDGEAGESGAHKESVLGAEAPSEEKPKKSKSFFSLMGYGKK